LKKYFDSRAIDAMAEFYRSAIELADSLTDEEAERFLNIFGADKNDGYTDKKTQIF
jgi:hypothetical protein